jgi:hypothetical protein
MIALVLAAQLAAQPLTNPNAQAFRAPSPKASELIRAFPRKSACMGNVGRLEVSMGQPIALYRKGDRPATGLKDWAAYPEPSFCLVEDAK